MDVLEAVIDEFAFDAQIARSAIDVSKVKDFTSHSFTHDEYGS